MEDELLAVGVIHSHPQGFGTFPSASDDDMDGYFSDELNRYGKGKPYLSLIFARDSDVGFRFTGRAFDGSEWYPVTELLTVGDDIQVQEAQIPGEIGEDSEEVLHHDRKIASTTARLETLLGRAASKRLSKARVGIIGCSGTGSPAAHMLTRAGVQNFVLVDPKHFDPSKLERMHGSTFRDALQSPLASKVAIVARLIWSINPNANVSGFLGNILDEEVLDALLECDLLLGCTDSQHGRAALGDLASHYLLPSIDVGVTMRAKDGKLKVQLVEICQYGPDLPCPYCLGKMDQKLLSYELMSEKERESRKEAAEVARANGIDGAQYWGGDPPQELTVGCLTTLAGSMAAGYVENLLTGAAKMPHQRFQFDVGWTKLGVAPVEKLRNPECSCGKTIGHADQARADRSVSRPSHWPAPKVLIGKVVSVQ